MSDNTQPVNFAALYARFDAPVAAFDCGEKCAPYNERGVPFCCDPHHAVPTVYRDEMGYLESSTDLWRPWEAEDPGDAAELNQQTPPGQLLVACRGHARCQRGFRSITCRSFPFFPYLDLEGQFLGLSYYWEYEDRCWVISNLQVVSPDYRAEFIAAFDYLFEKMPEERENFHYHSIMMRRVFGRKRRAIPLLHRNGYTYKVTPRSGRMRRVRREQLPKFGPYKIAAELPFPDEVSDR